MKAFELLFRWVLLAYPAEFRRRFADSMVETFVERFDERRPTGRTAAASFLVRNLFDVPVRALRFE